MPVPDLPPVPSRALSPLPLVVLLLLLPAGAAAQPVTTFGFDGVSAPGAFHQIEPGFANGPTLEFVTGTFEGGVILLDVLFGNSATSGDNILATCDTCTLGDMPDPTGLPGTITATFPTPAQAISLDVINGFGGAAGTFFLTAYDDQGRRVASDAVVCAPAGVPGFVQGLAVTGAGIRSAVVSTDLPPGHTYAVDTVSVTYTPGTWQDLGAALAGSNGPPSLLGISSLVPGERFTLRLQQAAPDTTAVLVIGLSSIFAPFQGGTFVPAPDELHFLGTDASGALTVQADWVEGAPGGAQVFFQYWIVDGAGPFGWAASNGVVATTP